MSYQVPAGAELGGEGDQGGEGELQLDGHGSHDGDIYYCHDSEGHVIVMVHSDGDRGCDSYGDGDVDQVLAVGSLVTIYSATGLASPLIPDTVDPEILKIIFWLLLFLCGFYILCYHPYILGQKYNEFLEYLPGLLLLLHLPEHRGIPRSHMQVVVLLMVELLVLVLLFFNL